MQFTKNHQIPFSHRATRVVVRGNRIVTRVELNVERVEDIFDIAFHIEKIELTFRFMYRFPAERSRGGENQ